MRRTICLVVAVCLIAISLGWVSAATNPTPTWANPTSMALKKVGETPTAQRDFSFTDNMDCQPITYRLTNSAEMRSGCFAATAFGMMDLDTRVVIFNGTDEGLPLIPYNSRHVLVPWPKASTIVVLDSVNTGGSYVNLYTSPLAALQDQRNAFGQLTGKRLSTPPDVQLKDASGQRLIINSKTLAMSEGGSWLVAETLHGSFVRINLSTLDMKLFAPAYPQSNPGLLQSRVTVSDNGRYIAIHNKNFNELKVYDLAHCTGSVCNYHDYRDFVHENISNISTIRHLRFLNQELLSFEVISNVSAQSGVYQLAPYPSITSMTDYIGLGDSYTSGEGAFDYLDGTDSSDNVCHLSIHSYPLLLTRDLFSNLGGHSVACSGARINDIGSSSASYRGQMRNGPSLSELQKDQPALLESVETNYLPGYVAQQRFVKRWQPKIVTVSVGGNDVGFGDILQECVMPRVSRHHSDNTCFNSYEDRVELRNLIDRTISRWTALYSQLKSTSPATQLYAVGYPDVIDDTGACALNVNLGRNELVFAKELLNYLNQGIETAAKLSDVPYVDISDALVGHRLCEAKSHAVAVNGLTAGRDTFIFGRESYHPNALGHLLIKQTILRKTDNLRLRPSAVPDKESRLLDAPNSGRSVANRQPGTFTKEIQQRGSSSEIRLGNSLLKPNKQYSLRLNGLEDRIIGSVVSDAVGNVTSSVQIPPDVPSGPTTIELIGDGHTGEVVYVIQPIFIPDGNDDADGDGVPNEEDSCEAFINSGQDADEDGIDDVCDPLIGLPPQSVPNNPEPDNPSDDAPNADSIQTKHTLVSKLIQPHVSVAGNLFRPIISSAIQIKPRGIYHAQEVRVNNVVSQNVDPAIDKSVLKGSKSIAHINPPRIWWIYLLFIPFVLWLLLELYNRNLCAKLRVALRVVGRHFKSL